LTPVVLVPKSWGGPRERGGFTDSQTTKGRADDESSSEVILRSNFCVVDDPAPRNKKWTECNIKIITPLLLFLGTAMS